MEWREKRGSFSGYKGSGKKKINKKFLLILIWSVLAVLLFAFLVNPIITGYDTYQKIESSGQSVEGFADSLQTMKTELNTANAKLSSCTEFKNDLMNNLEKNSKTITDCNTKVTEYSTKVAEYSGKLDISKANSDFDKKQSDNTIAKLTDDLKDTEEQLQDLKSDYDKLSSNLAHSICCKAKVDNPSINYYKIENDKVVCLEEGELSISCSCGT